MASTRRRSGSAQPATIPVGEIKFLHLSIKAVEGVTEHDSLGEWDARTATIRYDPTQTLPVLRETLLHEMLHCVLEHTGVDPEEHELLIRGISPLLLEVLRRNPELVEFLVG